MEYVPKWQARECELDLMRRAARKDATHNPIAKAFEKLGCTVLDLSRVGDNCPDMLCSIRGHTVLVEAKTGSRGLSEGQREFCRIWRGKVYVARSVDDAAVIVQQMLTGI